MVDATSSPVNATPAVAGVPEPLGELLEQLACKYCPDPISRFEMVVIWPWADLCAHIGCYLRQGRAVSGEVTT